MWNEAARLLMTRRLALGSLVGALALARGAHAQDASADAFIERVGRDTIAILGDASLDVAQRATRLKQLLNQSTDLQYVARIILGRHWRQTTEEQREEYLRLFDGLVLQAMAERIGSYAGETFEITGSRPVDEQDTVVSTRISQPAGGAAYRVDWRVRRGEDGRFRLIDIVAEGVSLVITQRSEVNDIVGRNGVDGLLAEMRRRLEERNVTGQQPPA